MLRYQSFIVLKLFAWGDRGERVNKDLEDLEFVLSHYEDDERAYDELAEKLANGGIELLDASIYLLGQDIYKILQEKTRFALNEILNQLIARLEHEPPSLGYQLRILQRGINSLSSQTNKKGES
ncbi:hypothetical protein PN462_06840 [Spirulina sp. CS-785/01]|uniref:hypothetical protein n=1 Tax=Spirulina sp. CS-785/01 TaxID=3021716 RepID=UPI00232BC685|nr:hypothetical protein [Spirulina sp. CS-785/01]MDB9312812.1 hypothetical protein [Spirulina sp. CS-785/01]